MRVCDNMSESEYDMKQTIEIVIDTINTPLKQAEQEFLKVKIKQLIEILEIKVVSIDFR